MRTASSTFARLELVLGLVGNMDQLNVENKVGVRWDWTDTSGTVGQVRWDGQGSLLTKTHTNKTLVPAWDNTGRTQLKSDWSISWDRGVKLLTVGESSGVVDGNVVTVFRP